MPKNNTILWKCPLFCSFMLNKDMNKNNFSDLVDEKLDENSSAGAVSAAAIPSTSAGVRSTQKNKKKKAALTKRGEPAQSLFI